MIAGIKRLSFGETTSTQDYLEEWLNREKLPEGTMVMADYQVKGKGVAGEWNSEPGKNLLLSLLFYPEHIKAHDAFYLNKIATLALFQCVSKQLGKSSAKIKWPNDILLNGKKTAGIILRNQIKGDTIKTSILGIGLNLNQLKFDLPTATSLAIEEGRAFDRETILREFCREIDDYYLALKNGERDRIDQEFISALFGWGEDRNFEWDGGIHQGRITGLDGYGRLEISTGNGQRLFDMKEIKFIL